MERGGPSFFICLLVLTSLLIAADEGTKGRVLDAPEVPTGHAAIEITGNRDLLEFASVEGWPGNGTMEDPVVIEGLDITYPSDGYGINLTDVNQFLSIRNCTFSEVAADNNWSGLPAGLIAEGSSHIEISNCRFEVLTGFGIFLQRSRDIKIHGTDIDGQNSTFFIALEESLNITVDECNFWSILGQHGIAGWDVENVTVRNCLFDGMSFPLSFESGGDLIITGNTIEDFDWRGISLFFMTNVTISDNTLVGFPAPDGYYERYITGIVLYLVDNVLIDSNRIEGGSCLLTAGSSEVEILDNEMVSRYETAAIYEGRSHKFTGNDMKGGGLLVDKPDPDHRISDNKVNGKDLVYLFEEDMEGGTLPGEVGQVILISVNDLDITGKTFSVVSNPVFISNCSDINVRDCEFTDSRTAVYSEISTDLTVRDSKFSGVDVGVSMLEVEDADIADNRVESYLTSIEMKGCSGGSVVRNDILSDDTGILLDDTIGMLISDNRVEASTSIVHNSFGPNRITGNEMKGGGIDLRRLSPEAFSSPPTGNTLNGEPLYYFFDSLDEFDIPENGSYYYFAGIRDKVISGLDLNAEVIFDRCFDLSVLNISVTLAGRGLSLYQCERIDMDRLTVEGVRTGPGIFLDASGPVSIRGSSITNCPVGIYVNRSHPVIRSSNVSYNRAQGIMVVNNSMNTAVDDCIVTDNEREGIVVESSGSVMITNNDIERNGLHGVHISYSTRCFIHTNHFISNNGAGAEYDPERIQAYDMHDTNHWYVKDPERTLGNFWSDLNDEELDVDEDGFIDVPYVLESEEGARDLYPAVHRFDWKEPGGSYSINGDDPILLIATAAPFLMILAVLVFSLYFSLKRK